LRVVEKKGRKKRNDHQNEKRQRSPFILEKEKGGDHRERKKKGSLRKKKDLWEKGGESYLSNREKKKISRERNCRFIKNSARGNKGNTWNSNFTTREKKRRRREKKRRLKGRGRSASFVSHPQNKR